jgi:cysteine desulfurase / selenocysteine lyase
MRPPARLTDDDVRRLRAAEFPELGEAAYLDAASMAPLPLRARRAMEGYNLARATPHALTGEHFEPTLARCRSAIARLVGAAEGEIGLVSNTSFGLNLAALGLPLGAGRCVLTTDGEFPANVYPWMSLRQRGVRFEMVDTTPAGQPDEARLIERMDQGDVAAVVISSVQFATGFRADLKRIGTECRRRGAFLVVDGIQSVGSLVLDLRELHVDVLACGGHKWLCGPFGTGFVFVRREVQEILHPRWIGWNAMRASQDLSRVTDYAWDFLPDARRYEAGTLPVQDLLGLAHSVELLLEVGIERIEDHVLRLTGIVAEGLRERAGYAVVSELDAARRSGILAVRTPSARRAHAALRAAGVHCAVREGAVRFAPHLYTSEDQMLRVLDVLQPDEFTP